VTGVIFYYNFKIEMAYIRGVQTTNLGPNSQYEEIQPGRNFLYY
jgi:hypothetical protein